MHRCAFRALPLAHFFKNLIVIITPWVSCIFNTSLLSTLAHDDRHLRTMIESWTMNKANAIEWLTLLHSCQGLATYRRMCKCCVDLTYLLNAINRPATTVASFSFPGFNSLPRFHFLIIHTHVYDLHFFIVTTLSIWPQFFQFKFSELSLISDNNRGEPGLDLWWN